MKAEPIENWIICISGFLQRHGEAEQGIPGLWHKMWHIHHHSTEVSFYTWDSDWSGIAESILRTSMNGKLPRILVVAYSWGAGYGFIRLARELMYRGLAVNTAILSDPVYHLGNRWAHRLAIAQVFAYFRSKIIYVPGNVIHIEWFRQRNSMLQGHDLVWENSGEPVGNCVEIFGTSHTFMDECRDFQQTALVAANDLFGGGT